MKIRTRTPAPEDSPWEPDDVLQGLKEAMALAMVSSVEEAAAYATGVLRGMAYAGMIADLVVTTGFSGRNPALDIAFRMERGQPWHYTMIAIT